MLAAHRAYAAELGSALAEAWAVSDSWAERVRAAIAAALEDDEALASPGPAPAEFALAPYLGPDAAREQARA